MGYKRLWNPDDQTIWREWDDSPLPPYRPAEDGP